MHFCQFSGNESVLRFQNEQFFDWKIRSNSCELFEYRHIYDWANDALKTRISDNLTVTSPENRAGVRVTLIPLSVIWFGFVEQHDNEYCVATKLLDYDDDQVQGGEAPIVHYRLRHSHCVPAPPNPNERVFVVS